MVWKLLGMSFGSAIFEFSFVTLSVHSSIIDSGFSGLARAYAWSSKSIDVLKCTYYTCIYTCTYFPETAQNEPNMDLFTVLQNFVVRFGRKLSTVKVKKWKFWFLRYWDNRF